jgi:hypothetical protein
VLTIRTIVVTHTTSRGWHVLDSINKKIVLMVSLFDQIDLEILAEFDFENFINEDAHLPLFDNEESTLLAGICWF